jgi:hypothetical protein
MPIRVVGAKVKGIANVLSYAALAILFSGLLLIGIDIHAFEDLALRCAAAEGNSGILKILLDRGANIHAKNDLANRSDERLHRHCSVPSQSGCRHPRLQRFHRHPRGRRARPY